MRRPLPFFLWVALSGCRSLMSEPMPTQHVNARQTHSAEQSGMSGKGEAGPKGDKGEQGSKGDKGDTGARGKSGEGCRIEAQILTCGSEVFDLGALKGATGDKGEAGATGAPGAAGPKGEAGARGEAGSSPQTQTPEVLMVDSESVLETTACGPHLIVVRDLRLLYFCEPSTQKWTQVEGRRKESEYDGLIYLNQCNTLSNPFLRGENYFQLVRLEFIGKKVIVTLGKKKPFLKEADEAIQLAACKEELRDRQPASATSTNYSYREVGDGKLILELSGYEGQLLVSKDRKTAELYLGAEARYSRDSDYEMNLYSTQGMLP